MPLPVAPGPGPGHRLVLNPPTSSLRDLQAPDTAKPGALSRAISRRGSLKAGPSYAGGAREGRARPGEASRANGKSAVTVPTGSTTIVRLHTAISTRRNADLGTNKMPLASVLRSHCDYIGAPRMAGMGDCQWGKDRGGRPAVLDSTNISASSMEIVSTGSLFRPICHRYNSAMCTSCSNYHQ
jgi:hypothetical protein